MGTAATATKIAGVETGALGAEAIYELVLDTTTNPGGIMTIDLTADFGYITTAALGGSDAANFYYVEIQQPPYTTALSATNLALGFSEAGVDGDVLDAMANTDMSAAITGLTLHITGKPALVASWA